MICLFGVETRTRRAKRKNVWEVESGEAGYSIEPVLLRLCRFVGPCRGSLNAKVAKARKEQRVRLRCGALGLPLGSAAGSADFADEDRSALKASAPSAKSAV